MLEFERLGDIIIILRDFRGGGEGDRDTNVGYGESVRHGEVLLLY